MLPDLSEVRKELQEWLTEFLRVRTESQMGVLWQTKAIAVHECEGFKQQRFDGSIDDKALASIRGTVRMDMADVRAQGFAAVLAAYAAGATDLAREMRKHFFNRVSEILEEAGQAVDADGRPLTPDLLLECFEKMDIDFDNKGWPKFPTLIVSPKLAASIAHWKITDDQQRRFERIVERKRLAWRDRESDRRLVD